MKSFLVRVCLFFGCLLLLTYAVYYLELYAYFLPNKEVFDAIKESKKKKEKVRTLIIGDSVGRQLFNDAKVELPDTLLSLSCNQAIDLVGQYLLLKNFLDNNSSVQKVYLFYNPFSFKNNLDHKFTYNYFIKPFYKKEYMPSLNQEVLRQVHKIPYYKLADFPPVAITFWTPDVQQDTTSQKLFLSEISAGYIKKMQDLTRSRNISFEIVPPPLKISRKQQVNDLYELAKPEKYPELFSDLFTSYFNRMYYLPDSLYVDGMHFKRPEKYTHLALQKSF